MRSPARLFGICNTQWLWLFVHTHLQHTVRTHIQLHYAVTVYTHTQSCNNIQSVSILATLPLITVQNPVKCKAICHLGARFYCSVAARLCGDPRPSQWQYPSHLDSNLWQRYIYTSTNLDFVEMAQGLCILGGRWGDAWPEESVLSVCMMTKQVAFVFVYLFICICVWGHTGSMYLGCRHTWYL